MSAHVRRSRRRRLAVFAAVVLAALLAVPAVS
jgi:hypothetical protein